MRRSYIGVFIFLSFITGVLLRSLFVFDINILYAVSIMGIVGAFVVWLIGDSEEFGERAHISSRMRLLVILLGPVFVLIGWMRVESALIVPCDDGNGNKLSVTCFNNTTANLRGTIVMEPDIRGNGARYTIESSRYDGRALVFSSSYPKFSYGDVLDVRCSYEKPEAFDGFDYPGFLAKDGVYSICRTPISIERVGRYEFPVFTISGIRQRLLSAKEKFQDTLDKTLTSRESTFVSSLVLGNRNAIPKDIQEQFRVTGVSHVMAISGMHIMILTVLLYNVFYWLRVPRHKSFIIAILVLLVFISIIGFRASGVRAVMFAFGAMLGEIVRRPVKPLNILLFVASALLFVNPLLLVYDVGFQLSFLAVMGLVYLMPIMKRVFVFLPNPFKLRDVLVMTLSAQLFTLPWLMYKFGAVSIIAPVVNILILPLVPYIMAGGLVTVLIGTVSVSIAFITGLITSALAWYVLGVVGVFSGTPYAQIEWIMPIWAVGVIYVVAFLLLANDYVKNNFEIACKSLVKRVKLIRQRRAISRKKRPESIVREVCDIDELDLIEISTPSSKSSRLSGVLDICRSNASIVSGWYKKYKIAILIFMVGTGLLAVVLIVNSRSSDGLEVIFFDVGQGDSHLIKTPGGQNILIDGGPDSSVLRKLERYLPISDRTIDLMVITHPHADHVTGSVEVIKRYDVRRVLATGVVHTTDAYLELLDIINSKDIQFDKAVAPMTYTFESDDGPVVFEILYPLTDLSGQLSDEINDTSIVTLLTYQGIDFLFTGDTEEGNEETLVSEGFDERVDVLKVGHHGSDTSTSEEFLDVASPEYAVVQVGRDNRYGHPSRRVLKRLERSGAQVLRNDVLGDIVFKIDDDGLFLEK